MYTENDLVAVAKRENNNKRNYLVVNRLQAKHVPALPQKTLEMFDELAKIVADEYKNEKVLLVGFAETATAIGARLATDMDSYYMQTTREAVRDVEYLYFTESHSHATEQKLIKNDLDKVINEIQRIIFVEDEVTTGNTIMKIIDIIQNIYEKKIDFSVASILNGMDKNSLEKYNLRNIKVHYLVKTEHSGYSDIAESYKGDGIYRLYNKDSDDNNNGNDGAAKSPEYKEINADGYINARRLICGSDYLQACEQLAKQVSSLVFGEKNVIGAETTEATEKNVLVIGTEEFMYPAIHVAYRLSESGYNVRSHSTTRSPITVSMEEMYPLHERYELRSVYDDERRTFIYNIGKYDKVIIITDTQNKSDKGIYDLCRAVESRKNTDITLVRWRE